MGANNILTNVTSTRNFVQLFYSDVLLGGAAHCLLYVLVVWHCFAKSISEETWNLQKLNKLLHRETPDINRTNSTIMTDQ